jgi:hypothetical protein
MRKLGSITVANIVYFFAIIVVYLAFSEESIYHKKMFLGIGLTIQSLINFALSIINMFLDVERGKKYFIFSILILLILALMTR